jgi:hypothetical protein
MTTPCVFMAGQIATILLSWTRPETKLTWEIGKHQTEIHNWGTHHERLSMYHCMATKSVTIVICTVVLFRQCLVHVLVFFIKLLSFLFFTFMCFLLYNKNKVFPFHFCIFVYLDASLKFGVRRHTSFFFK